MSSNDDTLEAVREQVIHLSAALAHDNDAAVDEALDELEELLDITDDDMDAFDEHYHQYHEPGGGAPVH